MSLVGVQSPMVADLLSPPRYSVGCLSNEDGGQYVKIRDKHSPGGDTTTRTTMAFGQLELSTLNILKRVVVEGLDRPRRFLFFFLLKYMKKNVKKIKLTFSTSIPFRVWPQLEPSMPTLMRLVLSSKPVSIIRSCPVGLDWGIGASAKSRKV